MKALSILLAAVLMSTAAGCAAPDETVGDDGSSEAALSSNAAAKKAVKQAIALFSGGDDRLTRKIELADAPAAVAPALKKTQSEFVKFLTGDDGFVSHEKDVDQGLYAVYASAHDHAVVAYAVWAYADNGDAGEGMLRGYDARGHEIVRDDDTWAED